MPRILGTTMRIASVLAFSASILLSGCASTYVPPTDTPLARITFTSVSRGPVGTGVFTYASRPCHGIKFIGAIADAGKPPLVGTVPANADFIGYIRQDRGIPNGLSFCGVTFSFRPDASFEYEVQSSSTWGGCAVDVFRRDPVHGLIREPTAKLEEKQCAF
jgi:hypothetical protein